jgi:hypothetical protein
MTKKSFFGLAAVLLVCGLVFLGCKDDGGGSSLLDGTWEKQEVVGDQLAWTFEISNGASKFKALATGLEVTGNIVDLKEKAKVDDEAQYEANAVVTEVKVGANVVPLESVGLAGTKIPVTFNVEGAYLSVAFTTTGTDLDANIATQLGSVSGNYSAAAK